jgi:hypothetical protein
LAYVYGASRWSAPGVDAKLICGMSSSQKLLDQLTVTGQCERAFGRTGGELCFIITVFGRRAG